MGVEVKKEESSKATATATASYSWQSYIPQDLHRTFVDSADSAVTSARSLQHNAHSTLLSFQDRVPEIKRKFDSHQDALFAHLKHGFATGAQHPLMAASVTLAAAFLFLPGPRRFLYRQTVGRLQSDEARFNRAEENLKMLQISVDLMKKESHKLLERSAFAEKEMTNGLAELINVGKQTQRLAKSVSHAESQAADLMDLLRLMPGREALRLRAEVASSASLLKLQRTALIKKMSRFSDVGVSL